MIRAAILALAALAATPVLAKEKAAFLAGTYGTDDACLKHEKIEAGGPKSLETVPEILSADGFKSWEGACEFTKIFEHEPGKKWIALMYCVEGASFKPQTFLFMKNEGEDSFDVSTPGDDLPQTYVRCDKKKEK